MRVFVTGAAGFIGSRLSKALLQRGDQVVGFDNFDPYYAREHKDRHLADLRGATGFEFIEGTLLDAEHLRCEFERWKPDALAHMAAMAAVRYSVQHPLRYGETNVQGSAHVLDAARRVGTPNCVLASTGSVYGATTPVPFTEDANADRPLAPYPASKRAMELFAYSYAHLWKLPTSIVRFFNVYGPHGRPDMMPWQWTMSILKGEPLTLYNRGRMQRDWTYVDDIVSGMMLALDKRFDYEIINLGCSRPVENLEFVRIIEQLLGKKAIINEVPAPASEPLVTYADVSKARRLLGYEPKVNVEEGLKRFVNWLRAEELI
ncbi:MAG TPA: NAD-dependent epimerase/dehydratase family protein [Tepidisphaeraceae bacterium]|nr:NAD-dependent epimerase/dehydratase family protein [Tepidisphaeraceae bacterium]